MQKINQHNTKHKERLLQLHISPRHSPLQLIIRWCVFGGDVGQVSEDLGAVDGEARQQDELLPGGAEQAGVVLYGQLAKERQLLDPGDLPEEQLIRQATQQGKQLHLGYLVPGTHQAQRHMMSHCCCPSQISSGFASFLHFASIINFIDKDKFK